MGVTQTPSTLDDGLTPICASCGVALCWDISEFEYTERQAFWDAWRCQECHPDAKGARRRWIEQQHAAGSGPSRVP
jgi:hypothetical protein